MITANVPELIAQLKAQLAAIDVNDLPTENQQIAARRRYDAIQGHVSALMNLPDDVARMQARLDPWLAQRTAYLDKEREVLKQIADAPDVTAIAAGRERDQEEIRQIYLEQRLKLLRDGGLFIQPGVTLGSLDVIDARITELTQRRDRLQSSLDGHLKAAEQLLAVATS